MSSADKGALQMRTSELFGAKHSKFFKIYGVLHGEGQGRNRGEGGA